MTKNTEIKKQQYLKPKQAAQLLEISTSTLARWRHQGKGPEYLKLPTGSILYNYQAVVRFVEECVVYH